jgi:hypothetical protein
MEKLVVGSDAVSFFLQNVASVQDSMADIH